MSAAVLAVLLALIIICTNERPTMTIWTISFWKSLAERLLATLVATLLGVLTADGFDLVNTDWKGVAIAVGVATFVSFLKGILANVATQNGPSLTSTEQVVPPLPAPAES
jgi:hypothetical protein